MRRHAVIRHGSDRLWTDGQLETGDVSHDSGLVAARPGPDRTEATAVIEASDHIALAIPGAGADTKQRG